MGGDDWGWPTSAASLKTLQLRLADARTQTLLTEAWTPPADFLIGGCFIAFARGQAGPGAPGDRAWAAAVCWPASAVTNRRRSPDEMLRGAVQTSGPRRARDVLAQVVVTGETPAAYEPGYLALREGPLLAAAVDALDPHPGVV